MNKGPAIKIKDSVDLFLSNDAYLCVYYMNTRQRKSFRVNGVMIHLLENIDGVRNQEELASLMKREWDVDEESTYEALALLKKNRITAEVVRSQSLLSEGLINRYTRQINYFSEFLGGEMEGIAAQKRIIDSHIAVFGCGAVGGDIALQLAMAGVGTITLFDQDIVEASDLSRHLFFRDDYLGIPKVDCLKQELLRIDPEIIVHTHREILRPESDISSIIRDADFIVNTLDEPYIGYTATKISRICMKHNKAHYIAGGFDAHLASTGELVIPYVTPCVECYATHFKVALKDWKPKKHPVVKRYDEIGGLSSMSLFSSSYACIEILKYIAGLVPMEDSYKVRAEFLFRDMSLTYLNVKKNPSCPICGGGARNES